MKITFNTSSPLLGGLFVAEYVKSTQSAKIEICWGNTSVVAVDSQELACANNNDVARIIARRLAESLLYGATPIEKTEVDHWLTYALGPLKSENDFICAIQYLNRVLGPITYFVGKRVTIADLVIFAELYINNQWQELVNKKEAPSNLLRWYNHIKSLDVVKNTLNSLPNDVKTALHSKPTNGRQSSDCGTTGSTRAQEGKFVDLPGAEMGKVVVRFPPEASGYLHIGHAKAALLNQYYQQAFDGKLIMRFDDTNPAKENVHFEKVILEDVEMLEIKPDLFTHTSQYFDLMLDYCEKLLKEGKAYADDTEPELMKQQREQKSESANRSNSYEKNMQMWSEMKKGTETGQKCCIRAKIDMQSPNGCMRDPTIYRCKNEIHPRTGDKYKVYPTYDFACPIVDAIENVTHTLRTMEYHDRDAQFYWFIEALGLRKPYIWEYSRLSMTNTVLSKRKLTWFVENNLVDGWDDPRFPTVRGVLRRGMTVEGLKQFIIAQGSSRSVVFMEWDKIWAFNKKVIDPIAPRYTAVDFASPVPVLVKGVKEEKLQVPRHPKNSEIGNKDVWVGPRVLIDEADAEALREGENATFINWGNLTINKINSENGKIVSVEATPNLENKDYKKTLKLTWLADVEKVPFTPTWCVYFEHIISKPLLGKDEDFKQFVGHETKKEVQMLGDPELKKLKKGDIIQLQRRGFFKVDVAYQPLNLHTCKETAIVLFSIPDGHTKENPTAGAPKNKTSAPEKKSQPSKITLGGGGDSSNNSQEINSKIVAQGDKVRELKAAKAPKDQLDLEVKALLALKAEYKKLTGSDWKPGAASVPVAVKTSSGESSILEKIAQQGDKIRDLKSKKAEKVVVTAEVEVLLGLKAEYKKLTGKDWKPGAVAESQTAASQPQDSANLSVKIAEQGDKVRDLKTKKADKSAVDAEVKVLLGLKADYKSLTGKDWKPEATAPAQPATPQKGDEATLFAKVAQQGDKVRDLKTKKAEKSAVDAEVKILLGLKADYKSLTGKDWKPDANLASQSAAPPKEDEKTLSAKVAQQGDKVRDLKSKKAEKSVVDAEVKILLGLKADYKSLTGKEWKPELTVPSQPPVPQKGDEATLSVKVAQQGDKVRDLKTKKAEKSIVDAEVKTLLDLKADYKSLTGKDWKPDAVTVSQHGIVHQTQNEESLSAKIVEQGDKVRDLKTKKAEKALVDTEVKTLLGLKADYKSLTGKDWKPGTAVAPQPAVSQNQEEATLSAKITQQGDKIRDLKSNKADKTTLAPEVKILLDLKLSYKNLTGKEWTPANASASQPQTSKPVKPKEDKSSKQKKVVEKDDNGGEKGGLKKQTKLGLDAKKEEDLPSWYSQVITKGELIEYYDVSGCYILRPWSFSIWETIKDWLDAEIKKLGVQNCYFPIFVSRNVLEKEKSHIEDFSPEVAWVTKSGDSDLAEPVAVRPTSETGMYPAYAKWIQSHRDLPIKLNQWNNVVRWEFKHPQPFLRTREFLWQEGHTAYANKNDACEEVSIILDLYAKVYTDLLAVPVIKGRKTEKEKFAGGDYTLTIEGFISATGRGIQAATSHHLGQNFSKMFEIVYLDPETQEKSFVYQNSWGITTRTIGVMVMVHADNQGLVLPPRVASVQAIVVPCGMPANFSETDRKDLQTVCDTLESDLLSSGVRVKGDYRDNYSAGWKFNHWELKGVPIRIEVGPKDVKNKQVVAVRRDTGEKITIKRENVVKEIKQLLENIQTNLFNKASKDFASHTIQVNDWSHFTPNLNKKNVVLTPFCGKIECEEQIKADSTRDASEVAEAGAPSMGAKSLCIPLEQPSLTPNTKCIHPECKNMAEFYTLFGRSY